MMSPGLCLNVVLEGLLALHLFARKLLRGDHVAQFRGKRSHEFDAADDRFEILMAAASAFAEIAKIDLGRVTGVDRSQRDRAGTVFRVCLEDSPGQIIALGDALRITRKISSEFADQCKGKEVRQWPLLCGTLNDRECHTVCGVDAAARRCPLATLRIIPAECRISEHFPILLEAIDDADFIAVLEIFADARQINAYGNA